MIPVIQISTGGSLPDVFAGYCQPGQTTLTFTNTGLSVATDVGAGIGLGNPLTLTYKGFTITKIVLAGVALTDTVVLKNLHGHPLFMADPDGSAGLADTDGDGYFDDLPPGQKIEVTAIYAVDCASASSVAPGTNCTNDLAASFSAKAVYNTDEVPNQASVLNDFFRPENKNTGIENFSDPDATLGVDTFFITHKENRRLRFFQNLCGADGLFVIKAELPDGLTPFISKTAFSKNGTQNIPLVSSQFSGNTLELKYSDNFSQLLSGVYEIKLALLAGCSASPGPSNIQLTFSHVCPACDCRHVWFCGTIEGPQLHATAPPCPPAVIPACEKGIRTLDFDASRTTFGFQDPAFTVPFNPAEANTKVALGCDSVRMKVLGVIGDGPVNDSVKVVIRYDNPDGSLSAGETFLFDKGTVRFRKNGSTFDCPVSIANLEIRRIGANKTLVFDLDECVTSLGTPLVKGDTIEFTGDFWINPNGPYPWKFTRVPNFRGFILAVKNGVDESCDHYGETFTIGKSQTAFAFPNTNANAPNGCNPGELLYRLFIPDNDFGQFFGNELRPAVRIDSIVFDFNPALLGAFDGTSVKVSIPGHPIFGNGYYTIRPLSDFPNGHYVASFDTLNHSPNLNQVQTYAFDLKISLTPTCRSLKGSPNADSLYSIVSDIYFKDRYYAHFTGQGNCSETTTGHGESIIVYSKQPEVSLENITPSNDTVSNNQAVWVVKQCNTSASSSIVQPWLALESVNGELPTIQMEDISDPANPVNLSLKPYGTNLYAALPALLPNNGLNQEIRYCRTIRITASPDDCNSVNFRAMAGWSCTMLPDSWTPTEYSPCETQFLNLQMTNLSSPDVSISFEKVTSTCLPEGKEAITIKGQLNSAVAIPASGYTIQFVLDENSDQEAQSSEAVIAMQNVDGTINPSIPLLFASTFDLKASEVCKIIAVVKSDNTMSCGDISALMPLPALQNAGNDQFLCSFSDSTFTATLGSQDCIFDSYTYKWEAIAPAEIDYLDDPFNPAPTLTCKWEGLLGSTLLYVLKTERPGCNGYTEDTVRVYLPDFSEGYFETDSSVLRASSCSGFGELCLNLAAPDTNQVVLTNNGIAQPTDFISCGIGNYAIRLPVGTHRLKMAHLVSGCIDETVVKVICSTTETISLELLLQESDTVCLNSGELFGKIKSIVNQCTLNGFASLEFINDSCLAVTGKLVGQETACLVVCDDVGICDTTIVKINVRHPFKNGLKDTIVISQEGNLCFDGLPLNLNGPIVSFEDICQSSNGNAVKFTLNQSGHCLSYAGKEVGTGKSCLRFCDANGLCDTIPYEVTVVPGSIIYDTVFFQLDTNVFCLDSNVLPGVIISIKDLCPSMNGGQVRFSIGNGCVAYFGKQVGTDTACIRWEDEFGNVALTKLVVSVVNTTPSSVIDTIFVGQKKLYCIDTTELFGIYDDLFELCPGTQTGNVNFNLEPIRVCIEYEGNSPGKDSLCVLTCDVNGYCDTTYFSIFVKPYFDPPVLVQDSFYTIKNTPVIIDFLSNDTVFGGIQRLRILTPSVSGRTILNFDNTITYIPDDPYCARWDEFTYEVCNPNGCDTTKVNVFIACIELTIFSAISPNNDGVNDLFYVAKIEEFPDNKLWVYNRWGNLVYEAKSYKNTWPGSWGEKTDLTDGTYFYILEWTDNGVTTKQRGYVEIFR